MIRRAPTALVAALLVAGSLTPPAEALEFAEKRADFYYDADGALAGIRHAELPAGFTRQPLSHEEKFRLMGIELPPRPARLSPRHVPPKPERVADREGLRRDRVIVKFAEGLRVRLRGGTLVAGGRELPEVAAILSRYPEAELVRAFSVDERILDENRDTGERISGRELADLNNYYLIRFPEPGPRGVALADELLALDVVETAYLEAKGEAPACADLAPPTPPLESGEFYLDPAPAGVDARFAWARDPGGDGAGPGFWIIDCEWGWCLTHEDLDVSAADVVNGLAGGSDPNHGTAVLGEFGACANEYGATGISPDVRLKMADFDSEPTWGANIATADAHLTAGEILLLEIHIWGPESGQTCECNCGQFEFVPVEWDQESFDAIQTATANGVVVVEAAGNGSMNLDQGIYGGLFELMVRDSGAILVAAGSPGTHSPECWTNHGRRIDVHGFGSAVVSTGYGDLFGQSSCDQDYTAFFSGTSSASPIIVGACASLQGIANDRDGFDIAPKKMRQLLRVGGTPQGPPTTKVIRSLPNLAAAIGELDATVSAPGAVASGAGFALGAPLPNPFTRKTRIRFDIPAGGATVDLAVYDIRGRRVTGLVTGHQPGGPAAVTWSGSDASGARVRPGVYFVRLEAGSRSETRKLTLLR